MVWGLKGQERGYIDRSLCLQGAYTCEGSRKHMAVRGDLRKGHSFAEAEWGWGRLGVALVVEHISKEGPFGQWPG